MDKEQTQKTQDLINRLKTLRENRQGKQVNPEPDGLSKIAKKIDNEILQISQELQEFRKNLKKEDIVELAEANKIMDELLGDSKP